MCLKNFYSKYLILRVSLLLLLSILSAFIAQGQQILTDPDGESCQITSECQKHKYVFKPDPGQIFTNWSVGGDLKLLSLQEQNPGLVCSSGYGKGRLTAHYYTLRWRKEERCRSECPDTLFQTMDYDLFKQFKAPDPIQGPTCAMGGQQITYWVPPILTDWSQRSANIGTDSYFWSGFPIGTVLHFSGDSSSVTATLPDYLPTGFTIAVQVGRCNKSHTLKQQVAMGQTLATSVSGPVCGQTAAGNTLTITIATVVGTNYCVSLPVGWSFVNGSTGNLIGNGSTQTIAFQLGTTMGNVLLSSNGGCNDPQTLGWNFISSPDSLFAK